MKDVHSGFVCKESGFTISITYPFIKGLVRMVISSVNVALELGYWKSGALIAFAMVNHHQLPTWQPFENTHVLLSSTDSALCVFC